MGKTLSNYLNIKDEKGRDEYLISIEKFEKYPFHTKYSIFASNNEKIWVDSIKGSFLFGLIDTGNGIKIKKPNKIFSFLGYDEAFYMQILLTVNNMDSKIPTHAVITDENGNKIVKI